MLDGAFKDARAVLELGPIGLLCCKLSVLGDMIEAPLETLCWGPGSIEQCIWEHTLTPYNNIVWEVRGENPIRSS